MVGNLLLRGMLVGILAGLLAFGFAKVFGEPQVDSAIAFEDRENHMAGHADEPELVSRAVQSTIGLATGVVVYGTAIGGMFALAFAFACGRIGRFDARRTAALIAAFGFAVIVLVPQIKYPANPPSIGNPETVGPRTALYVTMIALSLAALLGGIEVRRRLLARLGSWNATLAGAAVYLVIVAIAMIALPPIDEVPAAFSADVLWRFRVASLGIHVVLWTTLALVFGAVADQRITIGSRLKPVRGEAA